MHIISFVYLLTFVWWSQKIHEIHLLLWLNFGFFWTKIEFFCQYLSLLYENI